VRRSLGFWRARRDREGISIDVEDWSNCLSFDIDEFRHPQKIAGVDEVTAQNPVLSGTSSHWRESCSRQSPRL
jgi:hypothetical protein